ncbi:MAG: hypothetical protein ACNA8H_00580 [Anaerolineales bacterium]
MKIIQPLRITILLIAGLSFSACIDINQEITINRDGSGKFAMEIGISEMLTAFDADISDFQFGDLAEIESEISENPYVVFVEVWETSRDGTRRFGFEADVTNMEAFFREWQMDMDDESMVITLTELDDGNWQFKQVLDMSQADDSSADWEDEFTRGLVAGMMADYTWNLKLTLPNVVSTNGEWDQNTDTVEWDIPMYTVFTEPVEMVAEFQVVAEWVRYLPWVLACIGLLLLLLLLSGIVIFLLSRKKKSLPA